MGKPVTEKNNVEITTYTNYTTNILNNAPILS